ncbi:MAG: hypothetical protein GWQ08_23405 [Verrucomicrobiaceae bacterium]|nr:hypothetical protein [Verrucomicrobiaceae bacterium]
MNPILFTAIAALACCLVDVRSADQTIAVSPMLQFDSPASAKVVWESTANGSGAVAYGLTPKLGTVVQAESDGTTHTARLTDLKAGFAYHYKVGTTIKGKRSLSPLYEFSTALNFSVPTTPSMTGKDDVSARARVVLEKTGVREGYAAILGATDPDLLLALVDQSDLIVYAIESEPAKVTALREALQSRKVYGSRVSVLEVTSFDRLPITSCFANLILADAANPPLSDAKINDLLVPGGGKVCYLSEGRIASVRERPKLNGIGEWTHQYGDAGNTASSGETLGGANSTDDLVVQWVGRPGGDFGIDRNPRMPAPIASNGRLFHQGLNRLAAIDAYNGSVLWSLEIPDFRRVNIPRDCSNWCVNAEHLFIAIQDRAWMHDAATGNRLTTFELPSNPEKPQSWGYIANAGDRLFGSRVDSKAAYTNYWGGDKWYDAKEGEGTGKVCSDGVFAYDLGSKKLAWSYEKGLIINPTISISSGKMYFVETRHPKVLAASARQITAKELWLDLYLVALDTATGEIAFEKSISTQAGVISYFMQVVPEGIIVVASNTQYHLYSFHPQTGELQWTNSKPWPDDHHSGHFQHPVIVNDKIFLQPNGYSLETGKLITSNVGERSGCHTYVGAKDCLIYRGENRQIAMWDQKKETVTSWKRLRPSCWLSIVPSNGMLLVPEGGGGCSCGGWMETSLVFAPRTLLGYAPSAEGASK